MKSGELSARRNSRISTDETRYYLGGPYLHVVEGQLLTVTTDGVCLARSTLGDVAGFTDRDNNGFADRGIIIPGKTVDEIVRLGKVPITLRFDDRIVEIIAGRKIIRNKLIDATFVDYARVIPQASDNFVDLDRLELISALDRLAAVSNDVRAGLIWDGGDCVRLCVPNQDDVAADEIDATTSGALRVAAAIPRLLKLLSELKSDHVRIDGQSPCTPLRITHNGDGGERFLALLFPMAWPRESAR
jgi:DNA polymerase-3 subunit beta